jgi:hypothetical protein
MAAMKVVMCAACLMAAAAVDPSVPSIAVTTSDGRTVTRTVDNKSYLTGVQAGGKIDITYTEPIFVSVERPT